MATCLDIVNSALRKIGRLESGREAPTVDRDDAFEHLKGMYRQLISQGAFGRLQDVIPTGNFTAFENQRIFRNSDATLSITLPQTVRNSTFWNSYSIYGIYAQEPVPAVLNARNLDVRTPRDCSVVVIVDAFIPGTFDFIYDGQTKAWQGLYDLALTTEAPLSFRDPTGLAAYLAVQIVDEFTGELGAATQRQASGFGMQLTSRFSAPSETVAGVYF